MRRRLPEEDLLYDSEYWSILKPEPSGIVTVVRHRMPFESAAHCNEVASPVQRVLDNVGRSRHRLLIDSRDAPPRNSPEYEGWFAEHRNAMVVGFIRVAVLMKSQAGVLQTHRLAATDPAIVAAADRIRMFSNIHQARAFLLERPRKPT